MEHHYPKIDYRGFDIDGDFIGRDCLDENDYSNLKYKAGKVDLRNFDIDGFWYKKDSNGVLVNTGRKLDNNRICM